MGKTRHTSTEYDRPHRPLLLRMSNGIGQGMARVGISSNLTAGSLLRAASRAEKREDFGDDGFMTPLQVLLDATEKEARLHPFGRFVARQRLINILRNRLRLEALLEAHPEIHDVDLPPIILITGLQRTGTTKLHRLLASDPDMGSLSSFDAINPVPLDLDQKKDDRRRYRIAAQSQKALSYLAPDFFAIHPVEAHSPEEDVLLLDYALISTVPESITNVPTYARWVEENDNRPAYEYMKLLLKVRQWRCPKKRWVLKSPHHLEFMPDLLDVFPETTVVHTHRDPAKTLPSFCSMISHGHGIFSDTVDPVAIGQHWLRKTARMVGMGMAAREGVPSGRVVDIQYDDLLRDTIGQIRRIYAAAEMPLDGNAVQGMEENMKQNTQHKYGVHRYQMDSFGFTESMIREAYGTYIGRFDL